MLILVPFGSEGPSDFYRRTMACASRTKNALHSCQQNGSVRSDANLIPATNRRNFRYDVLALIQPLDLGCGEWSRINEQIIHDTLEIVGSADAGQSVLPELQGFDRS